TSTSSPGLYKTWFDGSSTYSRCGPSSAKSCSLRCRKRSLAGPAEAPSQFMPCEYLQPQCDRAYRSGNAGTIWAVLRWRRYQSEHSFRLSQAIARCVSEPGRLIVSAAAQLTRKRQPGVSPDLAASNPTSRLSEIP